MNLAEKWPRLHSDLRAFRERFPGFDPTVHPDDGIRKVRFPLDSPWYTVDGDRLLLGYEGTPAKAL